MCELRKCRVCGCTDDGPCVVADVPCCWVQDDLCSACATISEIIESSSGQRWLAYVHANLAVQALDLVERLASETTWLDEVYELTEQAELEEAGARG